MALKKTEQVEKCEQFDTKFLNLEQGIRKNI